MLFLGSISVFGQQISPYSRFGAGDAKKQTFGAARALGGLGAAYQDPFNINIINPASYAAISQTTLGMAMRFNTSRLSVGDSTSYQTGDGFIDYLSITLPLLPNRLDGRKMGLSVGIVPYSQMNYQLSDDQITPDGLEFTRNFNGEGRLYDLYFGTGVQFSIQDTCLSDTCDFPPIHKIGFGANFAYRFGNLSYNEVLQLENTTNSFNTRDALTVRANDIILTGGVQYKLLFGQERLRTDSDSLFRLRKSRMYNKESNIEFRGVERHLALTTGAYISVPMGLSASVSRTYDRNLVVGNGTIAVDTVFEVAESTADLGFPITFGTGFTLGDDLKWLWGVDFRYTTWSSFNSVANNLSLDNSWRIGTGLEITPDLTGENKKKIRISVGSSKE